MMTARDVIDLLDRTEQAGIALWIDGGWGVDALLARQTRPHNDLDIVVEEKDMATLRAVLEALGFRDLPRPDTRAWNFVLAHRDGREIDLHVIVLDAAGNGIYGPRANGQMYPAAALTGTGSIDGRAVRCTSAEFQVQSHTGYTPRPFDIADITALCAKFGLEIPESYRRAKDR